MPLIHIITNLRHELFPWPLERALGAMDEDQLPGLYKVFNNIAFGVIFGALQKANSRTRHV
jgi:hypothetical protein